MITTVENYNKCVTPGTRALLVADEENITIEAQGDYVSLVSLSGVLLTDMLMHIVKEDAEKLDDALYVAEYIFKQTIDQVKKANEEVKKNGKH